MKLKISFQAFEFEVFKLIYECNDVFQPNGQEKKWLNLHFLSASVLKNQKISFNSHEHKR